jgi:hypothetical protein
MASRARYPNSLPGREHPGWSDRTENMHPGYCFRKVRLFHPKNQNGILTQSSFSPELVGQIGKDYTVYAYDYSEYETPLVGQGMLSGVLATFSSTPEAASNQSKTMITGRVCKNPLNGLFSTGAQETLEVKLRLVPVPTVSQSEYSGIAWGSTGI